MVGKLRLGEVVCLTGSAGQRCIEDLENAVFEIYLVLPCYSKTCWGRRLHADHFVTVSRNTMMT